MTETTSKPTAQPRVELTHDAEDGWVVETVEGTINACVSYVNAIGTKRRITVEVVAHSSEQSDDASGDSTNDDADSDVSTNDEGKMTMSLDMSDDTDETDSPETVATSESWGLDE